MSSKTGVMPFSASVARPSRLSAIARRFRSKKFRHAYLSQHIRAFLATQIRALRGENSQTEFAKKLGTHQSVVSRYERQDASNLNVGTLIDIARHLDIGLIVRFVDYPTFLRWSDERRPLDFVPESYNQTSIDDMIELEQSRAQSSALRAWFARPEPQQEPGPSAMESAGRETKAAEISDLSVFREGRKKVSKAHDNTEWRYSSVADRAL